MPISDRLDEIQERADNATDGPWDEIDAQIRHTQIDGFTRPDERAAAQRQTAADIDFVMHARTDVPRLVAALRSVSDMHRMGHARIVEGTVGRDAPHCIDCQGARGVVHDAHGLVPWPCPTVAAIHAALGEA